MTSTFTLYARWRELEEDEKVLIIWRELSIYDAADGNDRMRTENTVSI